MSRFEQALGAFPRVPLGLDATPIEPLPRLSAELGIDLHVKRDDCTQLAFGGNKSRQLEYYFGAALAAGADTVLITGAVQSNYARLAAAAAAKLGLAAVVQLEDRVPGMDGAYHDSGNALLDRLFGAEILEYPEGEDEEGADSALRRHAERLEADGRRCYLIPLAPTAPPLGALGYVRVGLQLAEAGHAFDAIVLGSGSGLTHAGLLVGAAAGGLGSTIWGICVRRAAERQRPRIERHCAAVCELLGVPPPQGLDVNLSDAVLAPGYGRLNPAAEQALLLSARLEGMLLDPVYTAKAMAGLIHLVRHGEIRSGSRILFIHTGGSPALFGYGREIARLADGLTPR